MTMEPTYFLYAGKLFHDAFAAPLDDLAPDTIRDPRPRWELVPGSEHDVRHDGDPTPAGPESEPVGDDDDDEEGDAGEETGDGDEDEGVESSERSPASHMPMIPQHPTPDANPIDPRVF